MTQIRVVLSRENFRDLVAGREIRLSTTGIDATVITINLDFDNTRDAKYTDPPQAKEFLASPKIRRSDHER